MKHGKHKLTLLVVVSVAALFFGLTIGGAQAKGTKGSSKESSSGYKSYKGGKAIDGDTFRHQSERYRIQQYNAPELGKPGSKQATRNLQRKLDSGSHEWKPVTKDAFGRTIVKEREK